MSAPPEEMNLSQARTMRAPQRWPLVNTLDSRDGGLRKDAQLINAYAEKSKLTGLYEVEKRPGFSPIPIAPASGAIGQGMFTYEYVNSTGVFPNRGKLYITIFIAGTLFYVLSTDALGNTTGPVLFLPAVAFASGNRFQFLGIPTFPFPTILFSGDNTIATSGNSTAYVYNGTLTVLHGGDSSGFPSNNVPGFVYLNGFVYVMDFSGTIWQTTNQNAVSGPGAWSALDFITAASEADIAIQLARQLIYVVAIKTWTTQFFYDAGNPTGSSLSPVPGALYNFGCISADTFADLDGVLFWVTQSKEGTSRVVMIENLNAKFISDVAIEKALGLNQLSSGSWFSLAYQHAGHRFYVLTNFNTNTTLVYDVGEGLWYRWTDYQGNFYPIAARGGPGTLEWHQTITNSAIYQMAPDYVYPNDFGNVFPVDIYTPNFDAGVDRSKTLSQIRFEADQVPGSKLQTRFSDDDYQTWNNFRIVDLSQKRPTLTDEGSFYRRAYHLRHNCNTKFRIRAMDLQMDLGTL